MQQNPLIEHNKIFDLAYRFVTETSENIFLTGKAGTGKTTFLKYLKEHCCKNIIVAAPTGVAAINAGGVTLHSLFQLPFHPFLPGKNNQDELLGRLKFNKQRRQILIHLDLLVIDEISMVRADVIDAIDTILRSVRRRHDLPFGGVQLLCIGDLFQLPPVTKNDEWMLLQEFYASPFFFDSQVIKEQMPLLIELQKIYRQKDDSFVDMLNKVRNNLMDKDSFDQLHLRYRPDFRPDKEEKFITLTSHNNQADLINARELSKIQHATHIFEAEIEGDFPESMYPAEGSLALKEGAQVMFIKNDPILKRYFNGKIGVVKSITEEQITVDCDGISILVEQDTWENTRYSINREDGKLNQETLGSFTQFPLRLAWAITIHKSQGLTFEKVMIDAGAAFASGQVYVALSRCTTLEGIVLLSKIPAAAIYSNDSIIKGQAALTPKGPLAERFQGARQIYAQQILEEIFLLKDITATIQKLFNELNLQMQKINKEALGWVLNIKEQWNKENIVSEKFLRHAFSLMKGHPILEENHELLKRITDAAGYFQPRLQNLTESLQRQPVVTEHKEVAAPINELLNQLYNQVHKRNYYMQYCKKQFSITSFLQQKLKYVQPKIALSCYATGKQASSADVENGELYNTLVRWRNMACEENDLPIYMVANQKSLKEIARYLPLEKKDLLKISGFGKARVDKFGDDILDTVKDYCETYQLSSNMNEKDLQPKAQRNEKPKETATPTAQISFNLFKEGKTIEQIAAERKMVVSTIERHLNKFLIDG
ncbi:MAG: AAA family ATPase, partial [Bacteroidetes bacterium]|nr:AAA family ATPase [Bacteroidota bacterium]